MSALGQNAFVNMQYPAIDEMRAQLETEYADPEMIRMLSKQHAERTMILRVGRTVVYALAKQLNKEWDQRALETASSPESLSMAADDYTDALQNVRRDIGRKLRTAPRSGGSYTCTAVPEQLVATSAAKFLSAKINHRSGIIASKSSPDARRSSWR
jgi:hypothetical protein